MQSTLVYSTDFESWQLFELLPRWQGYANEAVTMRYDMDGGIRGYTRDRELLP
jgi:hypothetical protein